MLTKISSNEVEELGLPDGGSIEVAMDKISTIFVNEEDKEDEGSLLHTFGLGPCIAFIAKGSRSRKDGQDIDKDEDGPSFISLYHWSGDNPFKDPKKEDENTHYLNTAQKAIDALLDNIADEIGDEHQASIDELYFIGGQENSVRADDNTGTAAQVCALQKIIENRKTIAQNSVKIAESCNIESHFFAATEDEAINVYVNYQDIRYDIYDTTTITETNKISDNDSDSPQTPLPIPPKSLVLTNFFAPSQSSSPEAKRRRIQSPEDGTSSSPINTDPAAQKIDSLSFR